MPVIEVLRRQLDSARTLQTVVATMKALASVRIGQYRRAARSLGEYTRTLEQGFQVLLRAHPELLGPIRPQAPGPLGAVVIGSDQGLCGVFNEQVVRLARSQLATLSSGGDEPYLVVAGRRAQRRIEAVGLPIERRVAMPGGAAGIGTVVSEVLLELDRWRAERGIGEIYLFHNRPVSDAGYRQRTLLLLPLDRAWLRELQGRPWPTKMLPAAMLEPESLFRGLVRQYLSMLLFRAFAESLASENAARLAAMQAAERNIETRLEELEVNYRRARQIMITEELLDIQAGFEALGGGR